MIRKIRNIVFIAIIATGMVWFIRMPEHEVFGSMSLSSNKRRDTELYVVVHKARYSPCLYDDIAEEHNQINGTPTKLTLHLFCSKRAIEKGQTPYRVVVFEYDRNLKYIELN